MSELPLPPPELAAYVATADGVDPVELYLRQGEEFSRLLLSLVPDELPLEGARVLDFGCGSGRLLRNLINAGTGATFEGCDIHAPSIEWLQRHLPAPHEVFVSDGVPPLPRVDGRYQLIYAISVFSHLTDTWAAWLCELHRLLADGGVLIATFQGAACGPYFDEDPWQDDRVGMLVTGPGRPWDAGGPMVLHSEWWIRAHWGRAFEIQHIDEGYRSGFGQGVAVMRKRDVLITPQRLEELEPNEPRELTALTHALSRAHAESAHLNAQHDEYSRAYHLEAARREALQARNADLQRASVAARTLVHAIGARARRALRNALASRS